MMVAVTTYWAVQIWSSESSRLKVSQLSPELFLPTTGATEGGRKIFSPSRDRVRTTDSPANCSTGHNSESCQRIPLASSKMGSLTALRATTSKTR